MHKHTHFFCGSLRTYRSTSPLDHRHFRTSFYYNAARPISSGARHSHHLFSHLLCPFLLTFTDKSPFLSFFLHTLPCPLSPPPVPCYLSPSGALPFTLFPVLCHFLDAVYYGLLTLQLPEILMLGDAMRCQFFGFITLLEGRCDDLFSC